MTRLARLQRWMFDVITAPGSVDSGLALAAPAGGPAPVPDTPAWTARDRLHVYWNAYHVRLEECLRADFPVLAETVGAEAFAAFARGYIAACPPTSYTLADFGRRLAEHLQTTRPPRVNEVEFDAFDFLVDLARFERAIAEVFDGPGWNDGPERPAGALARAAAEQGGAMRVAPNPSLRLATYRFDVSSHLARDPADRTAIPSPRTTPVALWRRRLFVRHEPLDPLEFRLLEQLASGLALDDALATVCDDDLAAATVAAQLPAWLAAWDRAELLRPLD
jgi:hypothetical protein